MLSTSRYFSPQELLSGYTPETGEMLKERKQFLGNPL